MPQGPADAPVPDEAQPSRLRLDAESSGFLALYRDLKSVFGEGVRILHCDNGKGDRYGSPYPRGVPFSDPPPKPLKGRR